MEFSAEKLSQPLTYEAIYEQLPENKRPIPLEDLKLIKSNMISLFDELADLDERLGEKYQDTDINYRDTAFHHLLNGSGLPLEIWLELEADTKDRDYLSFITNYLKSLKKAA